MSQKLCEVIVYNKIYEKCCVLCDIAMVPRSVCVFENVVLNCVLKLIQAVLLN